MRDLPTNDSRKIVLQALDHQRPDRLPVFDGSFWEEFVEGARRRYGLSHDAHPYDIYWNDLHAAVAHEQLYVSRMRELGREGDFVIADDGWGRTVKTKPGAISARASTASFCTGEELAALNERR